MSVASAHAIGRWDGSVPAGACGERIVAWKARAGEHLPETSHIELAPVDRLIESASGQSVADVAQVLVTAESYLAGGERSVDALEVARRLRRSGGGLGAGPIASALVVLGEGARVEQVLAMVRALEGRQIAVTVAVRRKGAPAFTPSARVAALLPEPEGELTRQAVAFDSALSRAGQGCDGARGVWQSAMFAENRGAHLFDRLPKKLEAAGCSCDVDALLEIAAYMTLSGEPLIGKRISTSRTVEPSAVAVPAHDAAAFYEALPTDGRRVLMPGAKPPAETPITRGDLEREIFARRKELNRCADGSPGRITAHVAVDAAGKLSAHFDGGPGPQHDTPLPCVSLVLEEIALPVNPGGYRERLVLELPLR